MRLDLHIVITHLRLLVFYLLLLLRHERLLPSIIHYNISLITLVHDGRQNSLMLHKPLNDLDQVLGH